MKNLLPPLFAVSCLLSLPLVVRADTITFTLLNPSQSAAAGTAANFQATISAPSSNAAAEYINGDAVNYFGPGTIDDTAFVNGFFALETLAPGQSATSGLFAVDLPTSTVAGMYSGSFELLGGPTINSENLLGTVAFTVNATAAGTPVVPEPSSFLLLATGAIGLLAFRWIRRPNGSRVDTPS